MRHFRHLFLMAAAVLAAPAVSAQLLGTRITYQGFLEDGGQPKNGAIDLAINAFDADSGGALIGVARLEAVPVIDGVFTVALDFGAGTFLGTPVFLDIHIREDADGDMASNDNFVQLSPRQELTPTPYALHAESVSLDAVTSAEIADGSITASDLANNAITAVKLHANAVNSDKIADGSIIGADLASGAVGSTHLADNAVDSDKVLDGSLTANDVDTTSTTFGLQRRLNGACEAGQFMGAVEADGSPVCAAPTLDSGVQSAVHGACHPLGAAAISNINPDGSVGCAYLSPATAVSAVEIDGSGEVGAHLSVLYPSSTTQPKLVIAYYRSDSRSLRLHTCEGSSAGTLCNSGGNYVIDDPANDVGQYVSLRRIGTRLTMAYYDATADDLKLAICHSNDGDCSNGPEFIRVIDSAGDVGRFVELLEVSATSNASPRAAMVYLDASNNRYKYALCADSACSSTSVRTLDGFSASGIALSAIAADRREPSAQAATTPRFMLIAEAGQLRLVTCADSACTSFTAIRAEDFISNAAPPLAFMERRNAEGNVDGYWLQVNRQGGSSTVAFCVEPDCEPGQGFGSSATPVAANWHMMPSGLPMFASTPFSDSVTVRLLRNPNPNVAATNSVATPGIGALASVPVAQSSIDTNVARAALIYQDATAGTLKVQACIRDDCSEL